jgi:hypothetical protein
MKLKLPAPITFQTPLGAGRVSAADIVDHITTNGREFGQSGDLDLVRQGARLKAAFHASETETSDILAEDLSALRLALVKPSRGWAAVLISIDVPTGRVDAQGKPEIVRRERFVSPSGLDVLPLIEALLA